MHRFRILAALAALILAGCGSMGTGFFGQIASALFSSAKLSDALVVGFSAGEAEEIEDLEAVRNSLLSLDLLPAKTLEELEAVILPLDIRDEPNPREVLCIGELAETCRRIPLHVEVRISVAKTTADGKLVPARITWDRRP